MWKQDKFCKGIVLDQWIVLVLDSRTYSPNVDSLISRLIETGRSNGIEVRDAHTTEFYRTSNFANMSGKLDELKGRYPDLKLVIVILPDNPTGVYGLVKRAAELDCGMITQCIRSKTVTRLNGITIMNLLLKINTKLNGMNHRLTENNQLAIKEHTMIVGADVTHPSPEMSEMPSIAAVVASWDLYFYRYMSQYRLQTARTEIIKDMEDIMADMMRQFRDRSDVLPTKIIFFRDGISEGQLSDVLVSEVQAIQKACHRIGGISYEPGISFIVVLKRHHTRFFPRDKTSAVGKCFNVPPGTIVDTDITHPSEFDYYLVSHASFQGTSRPTKYHLIYDDNGFNPDQLQRLTYYLCHLCARCNRAISYPAPTYYAHLIAFRCRSYMESRKLTPTQMDNLDTKLHCGLIADKILQETPMYFV